jgi:hypothetical protein
MLSVDTYHREDILLTRQSWRALVNVSVKPNCAVRASTTSSNYRNIHVATELTTIWICHGIKRLSSDRDIHAVLSQQVVFLVAE